MADKTLLVKVRSIFSEAANRVNLVSGEDLEVSLGKISKWLSDLKTVAFTGSYNDLTDKPTIPSSAVTGVKGNSESSYRTGNVNITKSNIGLGSVENKSSATIRSEITSSNVTNALGYIPFNKANDLYVNASSESPWRIQVNEEHPYIQFEDSQIILEAGQIVDDELQGVATLEAVLMDDGYPYISIGVSDFRGSEIVQHYILVGASGIVIDGQTLKTVALTGSYNDLTNKPTIPTTYVSGVKGNTETDYRTGNVNITAANIGAVRYDTSSQGLTATQKSNARTNLGLGSAATYSSSSFASSTQGGYATDFNSNFKPIFATSGQSHASVFRGKYLGSSFTSTQKAAIADGSFDDLFVGDYWTIGGVNWRIADIDYYIHHGDTECTTHHIVIVPDSSLTTSVMNQSNDTSTGYYGSYMFQTTLGLGNSGTVYNKIANAFGSDFLLSHREILCNVVSNGNPSGWVWHSMKISIMNQAQILGQKMWMGGSQDARNLGISNSQFQLFKIAHQFIPLSPRGSFWLRDIITINDFVYIINNGTPYNGGGCKASLGVRPYFCLKGA